MRRILYLSVLALSFSACKKDPGQSAFNGTYVGTFRTIVDGKMTSSEARIVFKGNRYQSLKGRGSGKFVLVDKMVRFTDENIWTADFDWGLILNNDYQYETKGDSLILDKMIPYHPSQVYNYYQYRLKRIRQ
ncbi:hypothetical protein [Pedobacter sp. ASV12]|uniref:hypothetical protein n=1 Tax=Pedobacter sp. ASV12 TaxID=2795120 RepID=UPI0018EAE1A0|nr:hypothetical protein [Pedobacter sp. ASV12]